MTAQRPHRSVPYDTHDAVALSPHVIAKIYQLSNMFFADKAIAAEASKIAKDKHQSRGRRERTIMEQLRNELFLNISKTLLVEIAIFVRILDDKFESKYPIGDTVSLDCGRLKTDSGEISLSLREACNKVIHAKEFQFAQSAFSSAKIPNDEAVLYYDPLVYFWGEHGKSEWTAALDVRRFCNTAALICRVTLF
jgi:hypothetical protein